MSNKAIADGLKRRRLELKLSAQEVVDYLAKNGYKVAVKTVYGWENDVSSPKVGMFLKLCELYQIDDPLHYFS